MKNDYMSVMIRFKEERIQYDLTQQQLCGHIKMTQSAFSRAEAGLRRFSFPETKKLCPVVNIYYVFTGMKAKDAWRSMNPAASTAEEILCHLYLIHIITNASWIINRFEAISGISVRHSFVRIQEHLEYLHYFPEGFKSGQNIFHNVRHYCGLTQKRMAAMLGMDIKKLRKLEKGRLLPDSEVVWRMYDCFRVSPAFILKDVNALRNELDYILGLLDENDRKAILQILEIWTKLL